MKNLNIENMEQSQFEIGNPQSAISIATSEDLQLESFIKKCIEKKICGKRILSAAEEAGIKLTYQSLINKINAYKNAISSGAEGLTTIIRKPRKDSDMLRSFSPAVLQILQSEFIKHHVAIRAYEETHKILRSQSIRFNEYEIHNSLLYEPDGERSRTIVHGTYYIPGSYITTDGEELLIGSYSSASRFIKSLKQHAGDELYFQRYGLANYRLHRQKKMNLDYSHMHPNESWSLDNKKIDVLIMTDDLRHVYRPWLSGVFDASTRRYIFELATSPNSNTVANAIEIAINSWGKPDEIVTDKGKDYLSHRVKMLLASLSITVRECEKQKANSKMIESFHNIIDQRTKSFIGYTANKYQLCPERTKQLAKKCTKINELMKIYDKNFDDKEIIFSLSGNLSSRTLASKNRFMTESELLDELYGIFREYENTIQGGLKDDKVGKQVYNLNCKDELINSFGEKLNTPSGRLQYWEAKGFNPVTVDSTVLSLLAMNTAIRIVSTQGIQFGDRIEKYFSPKLKSVIRRRVLIKFTKANDRYIYVFSSDDLQKIKDTASFRKLTDEQKQHLITEASFICLAERSAVLSYNDPSYKDILRRQREEEKMLKISSNTQHITGMEQNIIPLHAEVEEIIHKKQPNKKYKDFFLDEK